MKNKINKSHHKSSEPFSLSVLDQDVDSAHELFMKRLIEILG